MKNTLESMKEAVKNGTAKILTTSIAEELKGKRISTIYFGYRGQDGIDEFIVGELVSELEYYRNLKEKCYLNDPKFKNRAEYWESYMTEKQLSEKRNTLVIITADGRCTFSAYQQNDGAFTCSDSDRFVYYVETPIYATTNVGFEGHGKIKIEILDEVGYTSDGKNRVFNVKLPNGEITTYSENAFEYEN